MCLNAARERVEDAASVGEFFLDIFLSVRTLGILHPTVGVGDLVTVDGVFYDLGLGFGEGRGGSRRVGRRTVFSPERGCEKKQASKSPEQTAHS